MKNDGGSAFPRDDYQANRGPGQSGMTLRDYFAAQAMSGMLAAFSGPDCSFPTPSSAATLAYEMADAMLKARDGK